MTDTTAQAAAPPAASEDEEGAAADDGSGSSGILTDLTVMMIDDEPMLTEVIGAYLEDAGYRQLVAINDPSGALQAVRDQDPALVLLDLVMPGVSGFEILQEMRRDERLRYTPVIVLTAASDPVTKLKALDMGATEFLAKPVDPSELVLRVRNSLVVKMYQDKLANNDPVTGLPNRRMLLDRLRGSLVHAREDDKKLALLHVRLDRLQQLQATLGQSSGDELLRAVSQRLRGCTRRDDDAVRVLADMGRIATRAIVWNDLWRSWASRLGVRLLTLFSSEMVRFDARLSVEKGFTRSEAIELAARAGLRNVRCDLMPLAGRFRLVGFGPGRG